MQIKCLAAVAVAVAFSGCASTGADQIGSMSSDAIDVSTYQLIAAPEKYDGRMVSVTGVVAFDFSFEGVSLIYPTKDDHRYGTNAFISLHSLSNVLADKSKSLSMLNGRFARVVGKFHAQPIPDPAPPGSISCLWPECNGGGYITDISFAELLFE